MSASTYVGRIGALAAALGIGAAIFTSPAIAWADPAADAGSSAPDPATTGAPADNDAQSSTPARRGHASKGTRTPRTSQSSPKVTEAPADSTAADVAEAVQRDLAPRRTTDSAESAADLGPAPAAATAAKDTNDSPAPAVKTPAVPAPAAAVQPAAAVDTPAPAPAPAAIQNVTSLIDTIKTAVAPAPAPTITSKVVAPAVPLPTVFANVANRISTVINSVVENLANTFSGYSPFTPKVDSPLNWLVLAAARRQPLAAAATGAAVGAVSPTPTLVLNGYGFVPTSVEVIDAFTGRWAYWPGQPNMLQGKQDFVVVNPTTGAEGGKFSALVTSGDPTSIGANYVQMLVTANDGVNVGTGAGQTPPVGSLISELTLGLVGLTYSAMPTPSGNNTVSVKLKTIFGSIPLPFTFDAAEGIVDHTFDNRPMDITGGFSIAPADPDAEKIVATIGQLPLFNSIQGRQVFGVFDSNGNQVGSFNGEFTTTSDTLGIYTQAILVTGNDGTNVGPNPGQTPPVGTVYNVAYFFSDDVWLLYSSVPQDSGKDVITLKFGTPKGVTDLETPLIKLLVPQANFNASREPAMKPLIAPGGQKFVPTSPVIPSGVNGLPPRDVQYQGYQQFDVYDFLGRKIGTIDADVQRQWDSSTGTQSKAILITNVTSGEVGGTPLTIPPVGTVMNFIDFGNGFGITDSVLPQTGVNVNSFQITTPLGNIPLLPTILPAVHPEYVYTNPFAP